MGYSGVLVLLDTVSHSDIQRSDPTRPGSALMVYVSAPRVQNRVPLVQLVKTNQLNEKTRLGFSRTGHEHVTFLH